MWRDEDVEVEDDREGRVSVDGGGLFGDEVFFESSLDEVDRLDL